MQKETQRRDMIGDIGGGVHAIGGEIVQFGNNYRGVLRCIIGVGGVCMGGNAEPGPGIEPGVAMACRGCELK